MLLIINVLCILSITMFLPNKLLKTELQRNECFKLYLEYKTAVKKLDNCQLRISFLEKCRDSDIISKFLNFRIPTNGCFDQTSVHNFQRGLLIKETGKAKTLLSECQIRVDKKRFALRKKVPNKCQTSFVCLCLLLFIY